MVAKRVFVNTPKSALFVKIYNVYKDILLLQQKHNGKVGVGASASFMGLELMA